MNTAVNSELEFRMNELERRLKQFEARQTDAGPTTDYKQVRRAYIGTQITEGVISLGGDGLGPTAIVRLFDVGGHIIGWLGSDVDVNNVLHTGAWIRDLLVSGLDELSGAAVGGWTNFVPTAESTASVTYADLATLDTFTVKVSIDTLVAIRYAAQLSNAGGAAINMFSIINIDGADVAGTDAVNTVAATTGFDTQVAQYPFKLLAASSPHVIKVRHKVSAGTGTWSNRLLTITPTS